MAISEQIELLIEKAIESLGYELAGVEYLAKGRDSMLRIYIDSSEGIGIEDCERVSHQVSGILEVEDPITTAYTLEVSSPGFDRPLFKLADFERFADQEAKISLKLPVNGRRNFKGIIQGIDGEQILILVDGEIYELPYKKLANARLVA